MADTILPFTSSTISTFTFKTACEVYGIAPDVLSHVLKHGDIKMTQVTVTVSRLLGPDIDQWIADGGKEYIGGARSALGTPVRSIAEAMAVIAEMTGGGL